MSARVAKAPDRVEMMIRMPDGMRKALTTHAEANLRSVNAEMLARLAGSLNGGGRGADARQLSLFASPVARRKVKRTTHKARNVKRTNRKGVRRG